MTRAFERKLEWRDKIRSNFEHFTGSLSRMSYSDQISVEQTPKLPHEVEGLPPAGQHFQKNTPFSENRSKLDVLIKNRSTIDRIRRNSSKAKAEKQCGRLAWAQAHARKLVETLCFDYKSVENRPNSLKFFENRW